MNFDQMNYLLWFLLLWLPIHFLFSQLKNKISKRPPGPFPVPVFGNLFQLGTKPHISLAKLAQVHGPVMALQLGQVTTVVVSSSSMAKEVLQRHDPSLSSRTVYHFATADDYHKLSLVWLPPSSSHWRMLRKIVNSHAVSASKIKATYHLREKKVDELLEYDRRCSNTSSAVNVSEAVFITVLNTLSSFTFSMNLADLEFGSEIRELVCQLVAEAGLPNFADLFYVLKPFDLQGIRHRSGKIQERMGNIFIDIMNKRSEERKLRLAQKGDFLDSLLDICSDQSENLEESHIPYLLTDLFEAGSHTMSKTLEWAMAELLHNPEKLNKARAELNKVVGEGNQVKDAHIDTLPYLEAVVKETFRMHPTTPFLMPRKANNEVELGGYIIPKDAQLWVNVSAIGRDPSLWENPDSFEPERFLGSKIDAKGQHFELIPFGAGRRICPGYPLVTRMLPLMLGALIHSFEWVSQDGSKLECMDMDDKFSFLVEKAQPLLVIPCIPTR